MTFSKKFGTIFLVDNMKNILIAGVAKSGKSVFCKKLAKKTNYNHIPLDYFTASMKRNFPDLGIKSSVIINDTSKKLSILLNTVTNLIDDTDEKFIIDSAHIMPSDIIYNINRDNWNIYFFGYPNISAKDKLSEIRKYIKDGWPAKKDDDELITIFEKLISISKKMNAQCKKYNIKFIDTSFDLNKKIDELIKEIL